MVRFWILQRVIAVAIIIVVVIGSIYNYHHTTDFFQISKDDAQKKKQYHHRGNTKNQNQQRVLVRQTQNASLSKLVVENENQEEEELKNNNRDNNNNNNNNTKKKEDGLNIVLFYADDWTMKVLGKLNPQVHTPNLDAMADQGILFVNNCVTTSVCWMSRATLMTGLYYSRHLQNRPDSVNMFTAVNWNATLFPLLKTRGRYHTGMVGKWHAPRAEPYMEQAFSDASKLYFGEHWLDWFSQTVPKQKEHVTELNRRHALEFLQHRPKEKNFALKVSFFATHAWDGNTTSYQPQTTTRATYYPEEEEEENSTTTTTTTAKVRAQTIIAPPKTATDQHWKDLPWFFNDWTAGRLRWRNRFEPGAIWQKNIRDLYAMATEVDAAIGAIIAELKHQQVYNQTLLIFTTDNGDLHGEHGLVEKWYPFEESINVPLIIVDPRMTPEHHGTINTEFTLNVDLAPTLLKAANINPSSFMQGRDIAELYLNENNDVQEEEEENEKRNSNRTLRYQDQQQRPSMKTATIITNDTAAIDIGNITPSSVKKTKKKERRPWRKDWFYEWNMGLPVNASG